MDIDNANLPEAQKKPRPSDVPDEKKVEAADELHDWLHGKEAQGLRSSRTR